MDRFTTFEKRLAAPVEISRSFSGGSVDEAVYCKLDWLTFVFKDCCTNQALAALGFNGDDFSEIEKAFAERLPRTQGFHTDYSFNINGVDFSYRAIDIIEKIGRLEFADISCFEFFDAQMPFIRVDISGTGLDYLRSCGKNVDVDYRNFDVISLNGQLDVHVTRVDTAYDFINYHPKFLSRFIDSLRLVGNASTGRVPVKSSPTCGIAYSIHEGKETTVYLGATKSERLLRIYDKLKQYENSGKIGQCPYICNGEIPFSWFRIELQCRKEKECHRAMFGGSMEATLRYIDDYFAICGKDRMRVFCWNELFDWEKLPRIIQNAKYVAIKTRRVRAEEFIQRSCMSNIGICIAYNGFNTFINWINDWLLHLQTSDNPIDAKRWQNFRCALLSDSLHYPEYFKKNAKGLYEFKF